MVRSRLSYPGLVVMNQPPDFSSVQKTWRQQLHSSVLTMPDCISGLTTTDDQADALAYSSSVPALLVTCPAAPGHRQTLLIF